MSNGLAAARLGTTNPFTGMFRTSRALLAPLAVVAVCAVSGSVLPRLVDTYGSRDLLFFVLAAVLAGIGVLRPSFSVVAAVSTFVFLGTLRRVFPAHDPASDLAAIVPFLVAIPLAARGVRSPKPAAFTFFLTWVTVSAGLSFARPLVSVAGWLNAAVPLLVALGVGSLPGGLRTFARTTVLSGAAAATYGIGQYFVPFSWDLAWLEESGLVSVGTFGTATYRPFATLPAPTTAATLCAAVVLLIVFKRSLVSLPSVVLAWAVSSCTVLLLLTQVRSVWLAAGLALLVGALVTKGRSALWATIPVAVVLAVLAFSPQGEVVADRAQTLTDPETDVSFRSRVNLLGRGVELASPFGTGVGSLSAGSRAAQGEAIDNGYLVILGELGLVGVALFGWVLALVVRRSHRYDYPFLALLVTLNAAAFALGGLPGILLWVLAGVGRQNGEPFRTGDMDVAREELS